MRQKSEAVLSFESSDEGLPQVVCDYRDQFRKVSQVLDANPKILSLVHNDLVDAEVTKDPRGRKGDYTSENIFRALVVQHMEGLPYRDAIIRIGNEPFLQMRKKVVMDFGFLNRCFSAIRPETWKRVNEVFAKHGVAHGVVHTDVIRTDTTVVESNIHYPTDASLLGILRGQAHILTRLGNLGSLASCHALPESRRAEWCSTCSIEARGGCRSFALRRTTKPFSYPGADASRACRAAYASPFFLPLTHFARCL